jgi:glutathione synthase/RimK-type ligase-like ATP-grasp enzyme
VPRRLVTVAVPGDKRALALQAALERAGWPAPVSVSWSEALARPERVGAAGAPGDLLRVESPGSDVDTWHRLARAGGFEGVVPAGRWRPGRAWFAGLGRALRAIDAAAAHLRPVFPSAQILAMTDKLVCQARLEAAGVPVPPGFAAPPDPAALRALLDEAGLHAVFVKPRWGSSGAGVLAWRRGGGRERLTTSARLAGGQIVNEKRMHTYEGRAEIDLLLAAILADGAVVQRWIPKAGVAEGPFDLRVLVIDGAVAHRIARVGRGPVTNLHLDAARADASIVRARFGAAAERRLEEACTAAAACFPGHRCVGVDALVDVRGNPFVVECNAWGDYLPRLLLEGLDSYDLQLRGLAREVA